MPGVSPGLPVWTPGVWGAIWANGVWASVGGVTVPDVVGLSEAAATSAIEGVGLVADSVTAYSPTVPIGDVISQSPIAGASVVPGSTVTITVSLGVAPTRTVPDVVGETQGDAEDDIEFVDLVPSVSTQYSNTVAAGVVIAQSPIGGVTVSAGSTVIIYVSLGPPPAGAGQVPAASLWRYGYQITDRTS